MQSRTLSRELALLILGQIPDRGSAVPPAADTPLEAVLLQALESLGQHVRDALDRSAEDLRQAQQELLDSELQEGGGERLPRVRQHQLVYAALKGKMGGELHALALETSAPPPSNLQGD